MRCRFGEPPPPQARELARLQGLQRPDGGFGFVNVGYAGFVGAQILAGAKLAHGTFVELGLQEALLIMGGVAVAYTVLGGLKAVIYTDTVQWAVLLVGLSLLALPLV